MTRDFALLFHRLTAYRAALLLFFLWWGWKIVVNDLRFKKVPNRMIVAGLKALLLFLALYAAETALGAAGASSDYVGGGFYYAFATNLALSSAVGIFLWYAEIWPAGDAKFFMTSLALLPLMNYRIRGFPGMLWLSVLINSFLIAGAYYSFRFLAGLWRAWRERDGRTLTRWAEIKKEASGRLRGAGGGSAWKLALNVLAVLAVFFVRQLANYGLAGRLQRLVPDPELLYFAMFIGWDKLSRYFSRPGFRRFLTFFYPVYLLAGLFYFKGQLLQNIRYAALDVLRFGVILGVGRFALVYLMERFSMVEVSAAELEPGMILSSRYAQIVRRDAYFKDAFEDSFRDGISPEETELLREWVTRIPRENPKIEVMKGEAFAVWIFAGCLFQLAFDGNLFTVLRRLGLW